MILEKGLNRIETPITMLIEDDFILTEKSTQFDLKMLKIDIICEIKHLLVASGPQRASFLNVQNLAASSKCNPDGHWFKYG